MQAGMLVGKNFLVIGRVNMDLTPLPVGTPIEASTSMMVAIGGSSANIAVGLVKLGCGAALATCVSDDAVGRYCLAELGRYGIDTRYVRPVAGEARNSLAVYEHRTEAPSTVIYRNNAADFQFSVQDTVLIDYKPFDALITTGTVLASEPSRTAALKAMAMAREAGLVCIFDIDYRPYSWPSAQVAASVLSEAAALCDVIVGNDEEFAFMAGTPEEGLAKARDLAKEKPLVVYKMGQDGALTFADATPIRTGIYPVKALKPNGAGDSFMAGMLASLSAGLPVREAVLRGSACASITVSGIGCAPAMPTTEALDAFLAAKPVLTDPERND